MTNKNILNYVMYGMIGLIVIIGIIFLTSGEKKTSNEPKEEVKQEVLMIDNTNININFDSIGERKPPIPIKTAIKIAL